MTTATNEGTMTRAVWLREARPVSDLRLRGDGRCEATYPIVRARKPQSTMSDSEPHEALEADGPETDDEPMSETAATRGKDGAAASPTDEAEIEESGISAAEERKARRDAELKLAPSRVTDASHAHRSLQTLLVTRAWDVVSRLPTMKRTQLQDKVGRVHCLRLD